MKCWICGEEATTGEHLIKASDLRLLYESCSQAAPIYFHSPQKKNIPVGSFKATRLKFKTKICARCNTTLTQPHDKAWEKLSAYLHRHIGSHADTGIVDLSRVFPGATRRELLNVHLYFVKLFGCNIAEHSIPIDLASFSRAIATSSPHSNVFLAFGKSLGTPKRKSAGMTAVHAVNRNDVPVYAEWFYVMGNFAVEVVYATDRQLVPRKLNVIHPSVASKLLKLTKFKDD